MRDELKNIFRIVMQMQPSCQAEVKGSSAYPDLKGNVSFYPFWDGTLVVAEVWGLPTTEEKCQEKVFGFHIHEGHACTGNAIDPFGDAGLHFNPDNCEHPQHAGDFPPLFENRGYALTMFYTNRFEPEEVEGQTVIIHGMPDDFHTQPSGDSGMKIACGVITAD